MICLGMGTTKSTTTTTRRTKVTRPSAATASSGAATTSLPDDDATKEGVDCKFDGLVEDKGNCQSKRRGVVL